jgi:hypothetical protein
MRSIEKSNDLIWNQIHDLLACSIVPQPTMLLHAPVKELKKKKIVKPEMLILILTRNLIWR